MTEECRNHPDRKALSICHHCGQSFCADCLIEGYDYYYCSNVSCQKEMIEQQDQLVPSAEQTPALVTIAVYSHPYEADLARSRLEAEGIPAFVADEFLVNLNWLYSNAVGGIKLMVPEPDVPSAKEILSDDESEAIEASFEDEPEAICPRCGGDASEYVDSSEKRRTYLSWLIISFPILPIKRRLKCSKCDLIWKITN